MFGAGNVGRGFLGQLFSESGYELVFVDIDQPLITALNARRGYSIRLVENDWAEEVFVSPGRCHALRRWWPSALPGEKRHAWRHRSTLSSART